MRECQYRCRVFAGNALRLLGVVPVAVVLGLNFGCGSLVGERAAPLFFVPLAIEGEPVAKALVDTGGGYEIMLRQSYGLNVVDSIEVVVFGGTETVQLTESFAYTAGGVDSVADAAIVGASICDCNGVGFYFFRKTGVVLGLDFAEPAVLFLSHTPLSGVTIDFELLPENLPAFDTSFIVVEAELNGVSQTLVGLLDTGANATVMRRDLADSAGESTTTRPWVTVTRDQLGSVSLGVRLSDNSSLPDMILGTDLMRKWADRWYFSFRSHGGSVTVMRDGDATSPVSVRPPL